MIVIGISGGDKAGKSTVSDLLETSLQKWMTDGYIDRYEISDPVVNLLESLGIDTKAKTPEVRAALKDLIEIPMRFSESIWLDFALRQAVEHYAEALDVLIVSGIRRDCEAAWVRDRGGLMVFVDHDGLGPVHHLPRDYAITSPRINRNRCHDELGYVVDEVIVRRAAKPLPVGEDGRVVASVARPAQTGGSR